MGLGPRAERGLLLTNGILIDQIDQKLMNAPASSLSASLPRSATSGPLRRSIANHSVLTAQKVLAALHIRLPEFAYWSLEQWNAAGPETREICECMLGWDVTDFGSGRFHEIGRVLFTLRNGSARNPLYPKSYAEKILVEPQGQRSPIHYHRSKREDIINHGGGHVLITLYPVGPDGLPGQANVVAQVDGISRTVNAGEPIRLKQGESLSIPPGTFHQFWSEEGTGVEVDGERYTVSREVSSVCDDWNDNVFIDDWAARFPTIIEDEPRACYLCQEYPALAAA